MGYDDVEPLSLLKKQQIDVPCCAHHLQRQGNFSGNSLKQHDAT
jgi:hypothetical protein